MKRKTTVVSSPGPLVQESSSTAPPPRRTSTAPASDKAAAQGFVDPDYDDAFTFDENAETYADLDDIVRGFEDLTSKKTEKSPAVVAPVAQGPVAPTLTGFDTYKERMRELKELEAAGPNRPATPRPKFGWSS